ncbi:hypothetical protein [Bradyrhizobium sp. dw_78]|uniref:hypothetical protein n=1 Tax=Bradyrhizobium sp. dw_78 TaxID=2719793 RepID=UPI001BD526CA|nr:hypothetical protein [Bradyrhizobium sp. dw_78]
MDNRINETRRKISALRAEMLAAEAAIRDRIKQDLDYADSSFRLLKMRTEMVALVGRWKAAGGTDRLPTVRERLKENLRPEKAQDDKTPGKSKAKKPSDNKPSDKKPGN